MTIFARTTMTVNAATAASALRTGGVLVAGVDQSEVRIEVVAQWVGPVGARQH